MYRNSSNEVGQIYYYSKLTVSSVIELPFNNLNHIFVDKDVVFADTLRLVFDRSAPNNATENEKKKLSDSEGISKPNGDA